MAGNRQGAAWPAQPPEFLEQRIVVERDGTIVARSGKVEYGQGIRTGFAIIVAEELAVPIDRVRVELGETDVAPWDMGTFGSMSTAADGALLRAAAAHARSQLLDRASEHLSVARAQLTLRDGCVVARNGRSVSFADLTAGNPLRGAVPSDRVEPRLAQPLAPSIARSEAHDIVVGSARYPADVRLPGMLRGHVTHAPSDDARLVKFAAAAARAMPGVVAVVHEGDFVGVVAERDEQALAASEALDPQWAERGGRSPSETQLRLHEDGGVRSAFDRAARVIEANYRVPHIAHASVGPSAAVADVRDHDAHLYVATQRPFALRDAAAEVLGLSPARVHVHPTAMGGMYGRGNAGDAAIEALRLSRAVKRPVLVQWTRAEEFQLSPHRPTLEAHVRAALDASGRVIGWQYRARTNPHTYGGSSGPPQLVAMTSGRNAVPPYALGAASVSLDVVDGEVRTGAFRSLAAAPHVFAIESFMDELARASGHDPIEFRLRHLDDERLRRVLTMVRERSGWPTRRGEPRNGVGVACATYHGTCVAQVAEVSVSVDRAIRVERVWCSVDAGRLVYPDGARNQIEGGIQQAASWATFEALAHDGHRVTTAGWRDYRIATFEDAPRSIDVELVEARQPSTGTGEPGSVPTAAALANAVYDAVGVRLRDLPLAESFPRGSGGT